MKTVLLSPVFLLTILNISESKWTEKQYEHFEQSLIILADKYLPIGRINKRATTCPGGNGKFGFNSYSLMTAVVLGFNAVSNVINNVNNNLNNNNNNNNQNDVGNVQGTSNVSFYSIIYEQIILADWSSINHVEPLAPPSFVVIFKY